MIDVPSRVKELVETFDQHIEAYHSKLYNETQRQINAIDKQIDNLVYKLYDLTEEEIAIVEGQ